MKRFYKTVALDEAEGGHRVLLDGRPVRTPARQALLIPSRPVAEAVAAEWRAQGESVVPDSMPILRLVNTAIDIVTANREPVIDELAGYGESDLLCYFADRPADLRQTQETVWRPLLHWAETTFAIAIETGVGIAPVSQDPAALAVLRDAVAGHDDMSLAALNDLVTISGSLLLALAFSGGRLDAEGLWQAARVDEEHQAGRWGWDAEAARAAQRRRDDVEQAARFLTLHRQGLGKSA